jgi:hypothetical protein
MFGRRVGFLEIFVGEPRPVRHPRHGERLFRACVAFDRGFVRVGLEGLGDTLKVAFENAKSARAAAMVSRAELSER